MNSEIVVTQKEKQEGLKFFRIGVRQVDEDLADISRKMQSRKFIQRPESFAVELNGIATEARNKLKPYMAECDICPTKIELVCCSGLGTINLSDIKNTDGYAASMVVRGTEDSAGKYCGLIGEILKSS